jgi:hypothetical protein
MTIAVGQSKAQRGLFDTVDDWLRVIVSFSLVGQVCFYSRVPFWQ